MSFIADPTPALPIGTADMIEPVIVGMHIAMPAAITITTSTNWMYGVSTRAIVNRNMPAETPTRPMATATLAPKRAANFGEFGAMTIITAANGSCLTPAENVP